MKTRCGRTKNNKGKAYTEEDHERMLEYGAIQINKRRRNERFNSNKRIERHQAKSD